MPQVGNKHFPYTPAGKTAAKQAEKAKRMPMPAKMPGPMPVMKPTPPPVTKKRQAPSKGGGTRRY